MNPFHQSYEDDRPLNPPRAVKGRKVDGETFKVVLVERSDDSTSPQRVEISHYLQKKTPGSDRENPGRDQFADADPTVEGGVALKSLAKGGQFGLTADELATVASARNGASTETESLLAIIDRLTS